MERKALLEILKSVSPTLATGTPPMQILKYLCFDEKSVFAYDGSVALRTACDVPIVGAVYGEKLIQVLSESRAANVEMVPDGDNVKFTLGRTKLSLTALPAGDFVFTFPSKKGASKIPVIDGFTAAVELASRSGNTDVQFASRSGITFRFGKRKLTMYATDNTILVRIVMAMNAPGMDGKSLIMHNRFYKLLPGFDASEILVTDEGDMIGTGGGVEIYGRVVHGADPDQFDRLFSSCDLDTVLKTDIPPQLTRCLRRAMVISEMSKFVYEKGRLSLHSEHSGSVLNDDVKIDLGADPISILAKPESILRYLDVATRIGISNKCVIVEGDGFQALIAVKKV